MVPPGARPRAQRGGLSGRKALKGQAILQFHPDLQAMAHATLPRRHSHRVTANKCDRGLRAGAEVLITTTRVGPTPACPVHECHLPSGHSAHPACVLTQHLGPDPRVPVPGFQVPKPNWTRGWASSAGDPGVLVGRGQ